MIITLSATAFPHDSNNSTVTVTSVIKKSYYGSDISCASAADAELTVTGSGGTGTYQYSKDNGTTYQASNVFSGLSGGQNYVIKIKDSNGNTSDASWIWVNSAPNAVTISGINKTYRFNGTNDVSCSSATDGEFTISAWGGTGTLQYSKDNGTTYQAANVFSNLAAGNYKVKVRDANGCTSTASSITLVAPSPVSGSITAQTNATCSGLNTGIVTLSGNGGVGNYN